jgi:hypothetical protein
MAAILSLWRERGKVRITIHYPAWLTSASGQLSTGAANGKHLEKYSSAMGLRDERRVRRGVIQTAIIVGV